MKPSLIFGKLPPVAVRKTKNGVIESASRGGNNLPEIAVTLTLYSFLSSYKLEKMHVRLHCLALGGVDLTSSAGKMTMNVINAVAQFERDLLIERTQAGLSRAKAQGKILGRPPALSLEQQKLVHQKLNNGETISAIARQFNTSRQTIMRIRDKS